MSNNIYNRKIVGKITATGKSAYESWLDQGNTGSIQDFLSSLADKSFIHTQLDPSKEWTIVHNLDKYPSVTIVDTDIPPRVIYGGIEYISKNQLKVFFTTAIGGEAYLN
jgi:hypothetical protein